jgi:hypothetical protein
MDRQFHLLDSFHARGSDGATDKVCAYEHLRRDESVQDGLEHWLPTGTSEYQLASGEIADPRSDGSLEIVQTGISLQRMEA